jgi:hypothetical protein
MIRAALVAAFAIAAFVFIISPLLDRIPAV